MRRRKIYATILIFGMAASLLACGKTDKIPDTETEVTEEEAETEVELEVAEAPGEEPTETEEEPTEIEEVEDETVQIYKRFLNDEVKVHYNGERHADGNGYEWYVTEGDYTFSELIDIYRTDCAQSVAPDREGIVSVAYAYIDCGMDGTKELALKIVDEVAADSWEEFLVIKDFDGSLESIYSDTGWARRQVSINKYGFVYVFGSGGAASHGSDEGYIDGDGKYHFIYYMASEIIELADYNDYCWDVYVNDKFCKIEGSEKYKGTYEILAVNFQDRTGSGGAFVTYRKLDEETYEAISDASIHNPGNPIRDSLENAGKKVCTPKEFERMVAEQEKNEGLTESIMEGELVKWKSLDTAN